MTSSSAPRGLPVGGRRLPLIPASQNLVEALADSVELAVEAFDGVALPAPYEDADPATIDALETCLTDHVELPRIGSRNRQVQKAFGGAVTHGWSIGALFLGTRPHFSGPKGPEGSVDECAPAMLSRASTYSLEEIFQGMAGAGFFTWIDRTRRNPVTIRKVRRVGQVTSEEAIGLLGGAAIAGFAIACAEYEIFSGELGDGVVAHLQADVGPHHHRFYYGYPVLAPHEAGAQQMYRCIRDGCRALRTAPPPTPHEHHFDPAAPTVDYQGRDLAPCRHLGCGIYGASPA